MINTIKLCLVLFMLSSFSVVACIPAETIRLMKDDKKCYEIMFTKEHVDCMTSHYNKLKAAIVSNVKRSMIEKTLEERKVADKKIYSEIKEVTERCKQKQVEFGPGTLGERKRVYCLNEGMKKIFIDL